MYGKLYQALHLTDYQTFALTSLYFSVENCNICNDIVFLNIRQLSRLFCLKICFDKLRFFPTKGNIDANVR